MTRARGRALAIIAAAIFAAVGLGAFVAWRAPVPLPPRSASERPKLLLLTSLPLMFGENFSLESGSPALSALATRYRVVSISVTDQADLAQGKLLLMAHPRAQPPEDLVAVDKWVRSGGRVLLLADPMLEWPSERPLGDALRPPPMFTDTGLLAHWGLRLDAPDHRGRRRQKLGGFDVMTVSPGRLDGSCDISGDRLVAHCRIGAGRVTVVADADLLDAAQLGPGAAHNLDGLHEELASLESR